MAILLLGTAFRSHLRYRYVFFLEVFCCLCIDAIGVVYALAVYGRFPGLAGWSYWELVFLYGFAYTVSGAVAFLLGRLMLAGPLLLRNGEFDRVLLLPCHSLVGAAFGHIMLYEGGRLVIGAGTLALAGARLGVWQHSVNWLLAPTLLCSGFLLYAGIYTAGAALTLYARDLHSMAGSLVDSAVQFTLFPVNIYPRLAQLVLTWVLPLAMGSFFPAVAILRPAERLGLWSPVVSLLLFWLALRFWHRATARYDSSGQ